MHNLYLYKREIKYPEPEQLYNPECIYPEYLWPEDVCSKSNEIYKAIRETLKGIGLDANNFGNPSWNPFGDFINLGDIVLLKPNWVSHKNNNPDASIDCLTTHTSILRAVLDYCIIALNGTGKIILGDAPIQAANLNLLLKTNHVYDLLKLYKEKGVDISIYDFRLSCVSGKHGVWHKKVEINNQRTAIKVDLGDKSEFSPLNKLGRKYNVMDYHSSRTKLYHNNQQHIYSINKFALTADVIINLPKPKCHKLSGVTAAMKNMIGVIADKACLPHVSLGSKNANGDAYPETNIFKFLSAGVREWKAKFEEKSNFIPALITRFFDLGIRFFSKMLSKNEYQFGGWYGNDTIWRTILDINKIINYADKKGAMKETLQRKQFHLADMIVSGEGDGPLAPSPKEVGILIAGFDVALVDALVARVMGFDIDKVPAIKNALKHINNEDLSKLIKLGSNDRQYHDISFNKLDFPDAIKFQPHPCWKGYIEA